MKTFDAPHWLIASSHPHSSAEAPLSCWMESRRLREVLFESLHDLQPVEEKKESPPSGKQESNRRF